MNIIDILGKNDQWKSDILNKRFLLRPPGVYYNNYRIQVLGLHHRRGVHSSTPVINESIRWTKALRSGKHVMKELRAKTHPALACYFSNEYYILIYDSELKIYIIYILTKWNFERLHILSYPCISCLRYFMHVLYKRVLILIS